MIQTFGKGMKAKATRKTKINTNEWMVYPKTSALGHAGEYFFAYWVARYFEWPCRLLDIDLGIDAQVEVYTKDNHSTGSFIGVQVKTTGDLIEGEGSVPLGLNNLVYWSTCNDPIVVILISLNETNVSKEPSILWRHLDKDLIEELINKARDNIEKKTTLTFSEDNHKLTPDAYQMWSKLWMREEDKDFVEKISGLHDSLKSLIEDYNKGYERGNINIPESGSDFCVYLNEFLNSWDNINSKRGSHKQLELMFPSVNVIDECYYENIDNLLGAFSAIVSTEGHYVLEDLNKYMNAINYRLQDILKDKYII